RGLVRQGPALGAPSRESMRRGKAPEVPPRSACFRGPPCPSNPKAWTASRKHGTRSHHPRQGVLRLGCLARSQRNSTSRANAARPVMGIRSQLLLLLRRVGVVDPALEGELAADPHAEDGEYDEPELDAARGEEVVPLVLHQVLDLVAVPDVEA